MAPNKSWLKAELQEHCRQAGLSFKKKDTKQDLLDLIQGSSGRERGSSNSAPSQQPGMRWKHAQLQDYCEQHHISFRVKDTKAQLLALIRERLSTASRGRGSTGAVGGSGDSDRGSYTGSDDSYSSGSSSGSSCACEEPAAAPRRGVNNTSKGGSSSARLVNCGGAQSSPLIFQSRQEHPALKSLAHQLHLTPFFPALQPTASAGLTRPQQTLPRWWRSPACWCATQWAPPVTRDLPEPRRGARSLAGSLVRARQLGAAMRPARAGTST